MERSFSGKRKAPIWVGVGGSPGESGLVYIHCKCCAKFRVSSVNVVSLSWFVSEVSVAIIFLGR